MDGFRGKRANPLTASLEGFSIVFIGKNRKLAKVYETGDKQISYNVSIVVDSSNYIRQIDAYKVVWSGGSGAEVQEETSIPDDLTSNLENDLRKMTSE